MKKSIILGILIMFVLTNLSFAIEVSVNNYDPKPAEAGKFVNVWFKIDNEDDTKTSELYINILPKDGLSLSQGETSRKKVGIIGAASSQTIQYRLKVEDNAIKGPNFVEVNIEQSTGKFSFDLPIEVEEKDRQDVDLEVGLIRSDPTRIKPDDEFVKLDVTLQNLGDTTAKGVQATLKNLPKGIEFSESYSNTELIGNVDADGTKTATFYIDLDESVKPEEYLARLELSYKYKPEEDDDEYLKDSVTLPVRIAVKAVPLYEITDVSFEEKKLRAGMKDVKMTITIKNIGEEDGTSVRVKVYGKSEQPFNYDVNSNFVAPTLKPGESGQATLQFDIDEDAALQEYLLDFEIKNIIGDDVITYAKTLPVKIELPKKKSAVKSALIAAIILGITGFILYKRKKKQDHKITPRKVKL